MKSCPYCGAELLNAEDECCPVCGQRQPQEQEETSTKRKRKKNKQKKAKEKKRKKKSRKKKTAPIPEVMGEAVDDGYDGYYNDVLPPDLDRIGEGIDTELMKKIILPIVGVALVIGLCIVMMYTL